MKKIKRLISLMLTGFALSFAVCGNVKTCEASAYWPSEITIAGQYAVVMEQDTGTVLYEVGKDEKNYPASITKIMTALLTLEKGNMDDIITFSHDSIYKQDFGSSSISRDVGEQMTVEQTLYAMMLESANECAYALGEYLAGDMDSFIDMMNEKAKELGCKNTHFNNPSGLPDEEHYTSCYDMALIARAAYSIPKFQEVVGTKTYSIPPTNKHPNDITYLNNHHSMLHYYKTNKYLYPYCMGGKTGYTDVARATLVTYAKKDGMTLVCVVMREDKTEDCYLDTTALFDYCFDNYALTKISDEVSISDTDKDVTGLLSDNIDLIKIDDKASVVLPKTATINDATSKVVAYQDPENEAVVGRIVYTYAGKDVGYADLIFDKINDDDIYPFDNFPVERGGKGVNYLDINTFNILIASIILVIIIILLIIMRIKTKDFLKQRRRAKAYKRRPKTNFTKIRRSANRRRRIKRR